MLEVCIKVRSRYQRMITRTDVFDVQVPGYPTGAAARLRLLATATRPSLILPLLCI